MGSRSSYSTSKRLLVFAALAIAHLAVSQVIMVFSFAISYLLPMAAGPVATCLSWLFFCQIQLAETICPGWDRTGRYDGPLMFLNCVLYAVLYVACFRFWRSSRRQVEPSPPP
jgi:hypothetical protein